MTLGCGPSLVALSFPVQPRIRLRRSCRFTLHGRLDSGEHATLLNARNLGGSGGPVLQRAAAVRRHRAAAGDDVDVNQLFAATRFRLGRRYCFDHLQPGDSVTDPDGGLHAQR
jgi:hypothetical protein